MHGMWEGCQTVDDVWKVLLNLHAADGWQNRSSNHLCLLLVCRPSIYFRVFHRIHLD